jgi:hypothetical protein
VARCAPETLAVRTLGTVACQLAEYAIAALCVPYIQAGAQMGSLCHRRLMRQRLPIDSLSLEQYTLARCVIQRSQMLQRTRCPVLAHRVILLRLIGRYWRRGGPSASRTQQNAGGLIDVRVLFRPPVEPNPHERVRRLSQPKELTHVAYLLDRDHCVGPWFLCDGASHTER